MIIKMNKNHKSKNGGILITVGIIVIGLIFLIPFFMKPMSCENSSGKNNDVQTKKNEYADDLVEDEVIEELEIRTPYGTLYYPKRWESHLRVVPIESDVFSIQFFGRVEGKTEQQLFDILFGGEVGVIIGYLSINETEEVVIRINSYDYAMGDDWNEEDKNVIYGMSEDVNYLIAELERMDNFSLTSKNNVEETKNQEELNNEVAGEIEFQTPYATLYYPKKWESQLKAVPVEGDVYTMQFYGLIEGKAEQQLFDIVFGNTEGVLLGTLETQNGNVEVYVVSYDFIPGDDWSEAERNIIYGMSEDVNYIINKLYEIDTFKAEN